MLYRFSLGYHPMSYIQTDLSAMKKRLLGKRGIIRIIQAKHHLIIRQYANPLNTNRRLNRLIIAKRRGGRERLSATNLVVAPDYRLRLALDAKPGRLAPVGANLTFKGWRCNTPPIRQADRYPPLCRPRPTIRLGDGVGLHSDLNNGGALRLSRLSRRYGRYGQSDDHKHSFSHLFHLPSLSESPCTECKVPVTPPLSISSFPLRPHSGTKEDS